MQFEGRATFKKEMKPWYFPRSTMCNVNGLKQGSPNFLAGGGHQISSMVLRAGKINKRT